MAVLSLTEAANLKRYIWEHFHVNLHIHDQCAGQFFSLDEKDDRVREFIVQNFNKRGIPVQVSKDGKYFFTEQ